MGDLIIVRDAKIPLELVSMFCGAGGLDEGFRQAGFTTRLAIDFKQAAIDTIELNHKNASTLRADLSIMSVSDIIEIIGSKKRPIGILGGPPCQSFSNSNINQDPNDPRNSLPAKFADLICSLNAIKKVGFFVFENVPGMVGPKHKKRYDAFKRRVRKGGFRVFQSMLDAKDYGVPQTRKRIFAVGINAKMFPEKDWVAPKISTEKETTVADVIARLPEPIFFERGLDSTQFPEHPNHWCMKPKSRKFFSGELRGNSFWGRSFKVLDWNSPSRTVAYGNREVHVHPNGHRRLSVYEAMLLQSFPKKYRLAGNLSEQISLVSDAVPPTVARHIALSLRQCLKE